ncbi:MAG: 4Fe-4S dicluster domain-containing protein [Eubacterium sp.]|jgi:iron only hydrogenase large subunit-like protein|nr:4Fe-4S dicluster domain-containing protein [Eubacterium sp.]
MDKFFHSVYLDPELCKGCINCLKRCPTEAIRVRKGKASITKEYCIDCGECVRICPHHAKKSATDPLEIIKNYKYKVALPPPSLYAQFNNLEDKSLVLNALIALGFDDVFEVAAAAEIVSEMTRNLISKNKSGLPIISSACPAVVRLIRVRFPNLIDFISPLASPMEIAAELAAKNAIKKTGLDRTEIGIVFITPCPAKYSDIYSPLRKEKSGVDCAVAMSEIYPKLVHYMKKLFNDEMFLRQYREDISVAGKIGISWGRRGGEASGLLIDNFLAADGIENVIKVLEDLEDDKLKNLPFIELNSCNGGCVGGVLTVENPYIAKVKLNAIRKYLPVSGSHLKNLKEPECAFSKGKIKFLPVYNLGDTVAESIQIMQKADILMEILPGLDCGCCGAPTCRAHAEDVARGIASESDCIHILRKYIGNFTDKLKNINDDWTN